MSEERESKIDRRLARIERLSRAKFAMLTALSLCVAMVAWIVVARTALLSEHEKTLRVLLENDRFFMQELSTGLSTLKDVAPKDVQESTNRGFAELTTVIREHSQLIREAVKGRQEWTEELRRDNPGLSIPPFPEVVE